MSESRKIEIKSFYTESSRIHGKCRVHEITNAVVSSVIPKQCCYNL